MSSLPTTLGQYQIIREIARSNDIVYEAYDPQMDRRVALKELNLPHGITEAQKEDRVHRFDREAKAAGRLAHPNIMRVFQVASDGERHYMAMEFLDGHTLRNEIDTKGFLPVDNALEIAIAVLKGLGHAHSNGVVHRDIKPDNIQLLSSGEIKITDFGIARLTFQPNLTMDGQVFGTPSYMSPEQVVGKEIDARSDLFSVGVLLYEMVSGQKPFPGDSVVAITYAIMNKEPEVLKQVNHSMWQVINRALDKSPALRYSSAQEMIEALDQATKYSVVLDAPAAPPGQTIYGQSGAYPMPPPILNPYGQPYSQPGMGGGAPVPPPIVYPYNPYQQSMAGGGPPHTQGFPQQYPQPPVYYPPPPRQPLLKPETRHFMGKLFLTLLVMGTLFAVVIILVASIGQVMGNAEKERKDQETRTRISALIGGNTPLEEKINQIEPMVGRLQSDSFKNEGRRNLAVLYEQLGKAKLKNTGADLQALTVAEDAFNKAHELDPDNPKLMTNLASLYGQIGISRGSTPDRVGYFKLAQEWWEKAADATGSDQKQRDEYLDNGGEMFYEIAKAWFMEGNRELASKAARDGMFFVNENSPVHRKLELLNNQITESPR